MQNYCKLTYEWKYLSKRFKAYKSSKGKILVNYLRLCYSLIKSKTGAEVEKELMES